MATAVFTPLAPLVLVVPWWPGAVASDVFGAVILGAVVAVPAPGWALAFGAVLVAGRVRTGALVLDACGVVVDLRPCARKGTIA